MLMLAMLALGLGLVVYLANTNTEVDKYVQFNEHRISLALRWQGMEALSMERAVIAAVS